MDLKRISQIIKAKSQDPIKDVAGQDVFDKKKNRIGKKYDVGTGPLGAKVFVYDENPNVYNVHYQGKVQPMSKEQAMDFLTVEGSADAVSLNELLRKAALSKAQEEDIKKINKNGKA
jgi:hypothetical protein